MASMETTLAVQRLHAQYGQLIDDLRIAELGDLFCEGGVWEAAPLRYEGRTAIVAGLREIEPDQPHVVRHLAFGAIVDERDDGTVVASADAIALQYGEPSVIVAAGRYYDLIRREAGRWRFARRTFVYSGQPLPEGIPPVSTSA